MEGRWFSKSGSRFGAADIRLKSLQQFHGWRAGHFQNRALALPLRTFVLKVCNSYTDGGRVVFKMGLSPWRRGHSSSKFAIAKGMEGGSFSKLGSRWGASQIRLKSLQQLHGWRAGRFQNGALALVPRAFAYLQRYSFSKDMRAHW